MPQDYSGTYQLVHQENLDAYLKALDIGAALRKVVKLLRPTKEVHQDGSHMVIRTLTALRSYTMEFDVGVPFEEDLGPIDGRKCQWARRSPVENPRPPSPGRRVAAGDLGPVIAGYTSSSGIDGGGGGERDIATVAGETPVRCHRDPCRGRRVPPPSRRLPLPRV
ncbi:retinol-binding protein 5-like [Mobula birostris]|uniref:retinol-binding protein 5-like n=1 Tax=Mobula birostris TaxID=1983395 RepID=UPI003B27DD1F